MKTIIAKIHIAKQQLGMDDDTYRAMLQAVAGVRSAKGLSVAGASAVLQHLQRCGWKPKPAKKAGRKPTPPAGRRTVISKVEALLAEAKRPWDYAHAMALRMFQVEKVDWLDDQQLQKLLAALIYDAKRHGRPT